jgi:flagellar biosynthesis protein
MKTEHKESPPPYGPLIPKGKRAVAVAVKGNAHDADAPAEIVAAGRGNLAEQILEMAFAHGIKVREDASLAEMLAQMELDTPIPSEAIVAVAEILAKVYEADARQRINAE